MPWRPNGIAHAVQCSRHAIQPLRHSRVSSPMSTCLAMRQPARGYATEHQSNQSFQPDVPPEMQKDFASASEIDLRNFQNRPARIVPSSPSYFTASPKTTDILLGLERLLAKYESLPTVHANDAPKMAWLRAPDFAATINEELPTKKYRAIMKIVQRLNLIELTLAPKEVRLQLEQFLRPGNPYGTKSAPQQVDEMGRARGKGKRKTCSAVAYLVEGEGEFMVNGKSLLETFGRMHDRESASWALRSTQRLDKYNVFAITKGGGVTGQAEAIMLAVAKALVVHEPGLKTYLRKTGVITVDRRQVERKKPGRRKARKMPRWVKR